MYAICKLNKIICTIPQPSSLHHPSPTSFPTLLLPYVTISLPYSLSSIFSPTSLTSIIPSSSLQLLQSYPSITPLPSSLTIFQPSSSFLYLFLQPISYYLRIYKSPFHISLLPFSFLISTHPSFLSSPSARLFPSLILPCLHHSLISFPSPFYSPSSSHLPSPPFFPYSFYPPVFITPSFYSHLHSISTSIPFPPLLHSHLHYIPTSITFQPLLYSHLHYIPSSITFLPPLHSHLHSIPLPRLTSHLPVYFPHSLLSLYLSPPTP